MCFFLEVFFDFLRDLQTESNMTNTFPWVIQSLSRHPTWKWKVIFSKQQYPLLLGASGSVPVGWGGKKHSTLAFAKLDFRCDLKHEGEAWWHLLKWANWKMGSLKDFLLIESDTRGDKHQIIKYEMGMDDSWHFGPVKLEISWQYHTDEPWAHLPERWIGGL